MKRFLLLVVPIAASLIGVLPGQVPGRTLMRSFAIGDLRLAITVVDGEIRWTSRRPQPKRGVLRSAVVHASSLVEIETAAYLLAGATATGFGLVRLDWREGEGLTLAHQVETPFLAGSLAVSPRPAQHVFALDRRRGEIHVAPLEGARLPRQAWVLVATAADCPLLLQPAVIHSTHLGDDADGAYAVDGARSFPVQVRYYCIRADHWRIERRVVRLPGYDSAAVGPRSTRGEAIERHGLPRAFGAVRVERLTCVPASCRVGSGKYSVGASYSFAELQEPTPVLVVWWYAVQAPGASLPIELLPGDLALLRPDFVCSKAVWSARKGASHEAVACPLPIPARSAEQLVGATVHGQMVVVGPGAADVAVSDIVSVALLPSHRSGSRGERQAYQAAVDSWRTYSATRDHRFLTDLRSRIRDLSVR